MRCTWRRRLFLADASAEREEQNEDACASVGWRGIIVFIDAFGKLRRREAEGPRPRRWIHGAMGAFGWIRCQAILLGVLWLGWIIPAYNPRVNRQAPIGGAAPLDGYRRS